MSSYDEHLISMAGGDGDPLDAIQRRADNATEGPWRWDDKFGDKADEGLALTNNDGAEIVGAYNYHCCSFRDDPNVEDNDAEFIANARTDVPTLLALVRAQQATLAAVLNLANTAGRTGWRISADELRKVLRGES